MLARLTGAPELLARLTRNTEVAGEGLPGAPRLPAKLDLKCASRRIIACSNRKTEDCWEIDGERPPPGFWIGFTSSTILNGHI